MKKIYTWENHDDYARYWTKESIEAREEFNKNYTEENSKIDLEKSDIAEKYLVPSSNPHDLDEWNPPVIIEDPDDDGNLRLKGDFHSAWSFESYIVSQNMVDKLGDILLKYGEIFPLNVEDREDKLYRYWVNTEIPFECVDKEKSKFFENDYDENGTFKIERLVLKEDCKNDAIIFRVKGEYKKTIFVTEEFIKLVKKHNLKGFKFAPDTSYEYARNNGVYILVG